MSADRRSDDDGDLDLPAAMEDGVTAGPTAASPGTGDACKSSQMGPLELTAYKTDWRTSARFRRHVLEATVARERERPAKALEGKAPITAAKTPPFPKGMPHDGRQF